MNDSCRQTVSRSMDLLFSLSLTSDPVRAILSKHYFSRKSLRNYLKLPWMLNWIWIFEFVSYSLTRCTFKMAHLRLMASELSQNTQLNSLSQPSSQKCYFGFLKCFRFVIGCYWCENLKTIFSYTKASELYQLLLGFYLNGSHKSAVLNISNFVKLMSL